MRDLDGWTLLFDLDGTLVDSAPDLIGTLNRMLALKGLQSVPVSSARHLVGHGARALLRHGFREAGTVWDEAGEPELFDRFIADYVDNIAEHTRPFPQVVETLDRLSDRGAVHVVATNKRTDLSLALLDALGLTGRFALVAGPDRVSARKPDAAHLLDALQLVGGDRHRAVMVGDASTDTGAARAAALPCIVCTFGYNDLPPAELGGDVALDHWDGFEAALDTARRLQLP